MEMGQIKPVGAEQWHVAPSPADDALPHELSMAAPSWRGWIHAAAFPVAMVLGILLLIGADGAAAIWGSSIFFASSLLLFGVSALYHRIPWRPGVAAVVRRVDHANIYLLIAGTYTPLSLLLLPPDKATEVLVVVWTGAAIGMGFRILWLGAPRWLSVALYVVLGWTAVLFVADLFRASWPTTALVLTGGILYSAGGVIYGLKRPNPIPRTFGFHEVFHALTVAAFACHWTGIFLVSSNPPLV